MKQFTKLNTSFECINCSKFVQPHPKSSRDHCNFCLYGKHVDIYPGDRLNECKGVLIPIGLKISNGKTQIVYRCSKCEQIVHCVKAPDDDELKIIEMSKKVW